jgi:hypothetical protein
MKWKQPSINLEPWALFNAQLSDSVNPGRPFLPDVAAENDLGNFDRGTTPMDIEDGPLQLSRASNIQDSASNM